MDPFDEFEFKPLTDGLGFHKKVTPLKDQVQSSGLLEEKLKTLPSSAPMSFTEKENTRAPKSFEDVINALEKPAKSSAMADMGFIEITEALPRDKKPSMKTMDVEIPRPIQSPFPGPETFKGPAVKLPNAGKNGKPGAAAKKAELGDQVGTRRGAADSPQNQLVPAASSLPSAFLDLIVIVALCLIFTVALLMVTKVDLNLVLRNLNGDLMTQISFAVLFVSLMQIYVIICRSFYGRTLGEWTFDVQLGKEDEQKSLLYPLKVAWRSVVTTITGLVVLPTLSILFRTDLAGKLCGVQLYKQRE